MPKWKVSGAITYTMTVRVHLPTEIIEAPSKDAAIDQTVEDFSADLEGEVDDWNDYDLKVEMIPGSDEDEEPEEIPIDVQLRRIGAPELPLVFA